MPFTLFGYGEQRVSSVLAGIWNATTPLVVLPLAVLRLPHRADDRAPGRRPRARASSGCWWCSGVWQGVGGAQFTGQLMCFGAAACYGVAIPYQKRFVAGRPESGLVARRRAAAASPTVQLAIVAPLRRRRPAAADATCRPR